MPVSWNGQYECAEYIDPSESLTQYYEAFAFFNNIDVRDFYWTTSTSPDGNYMLGTVILHEMGHVLTMGHSTGLIGNPRIMDKSYSPAEVVPILTAGDKSNAAFHSEQLYDIAVGISNSIGITSYPTLIDENQQYSLTAVFSKADPYSADHVLSWNWIIKLYHQNGTYELVNKTFSGTPYDISCSWTLSTNTLPSGYNWTLNHSGHIAGDIFLTAQIAGHSVQPVAKIISFNTAPTQPQNIRIVWAGNHPKLTWNTNLEEDIATYKIWKYAGSPSVVATVTNNPNNSTQSWIDYNVTKTGKFSGYQFRYKVKAVDNTNKESLYSNEVSIFGNGVIWKIGNAGNENNITTYKLFPNFPNPFNPSTNIEFQIPKDSFVALIVYNSLGQKIKTLVNSNLSTGKYHVEFNADNLPSGLYIYKLQAGEFSSVKKMMLTK